MPSHNNNNNNNTVSSSNFGKGALALVCLTVVTLFVIVLFGNRKLLDSTKPAAGRGTKNASSSSSSSLSVFDELRAFGSSSKNATSPLPNALQQLHSALSGLTTSTLRRSSSSSPNNNNKPAPTESSIISPPFATSAEFKTTTPSANPSELYALEGRRAPIVNGTFGPDPNAIVPCVIFSDWAANYRRGNDRRMYKEFMPRNAVLPTHGDDGQYCFVALEVPNAVFTIMFDDPKWCCVYIPAMHVPTGLFVGVDVHFHDYLYRGIINSQEWRVWRRRLDKDTEPIRHELPMSFWEKYYQSRSGRATEEEMLFESSAANASASMTAQDRLSVEQAMAKLKQQQQQQQNSPSSSDKAIHGESRRENVFIDEKLVASVTNGRVKPVPVDTEYVHILVTDLVGMMPAVTSAMFFGYWAHFYSSGIQALGKERVTVVINSRDWHKNTNTRLLEEWTRFLPVPALYLPRNQTFFAKKLTFASRGYNDVVEPCVFHFLRHWLVPTVVQHFRLAMRNGRTMALLNADAAAMKPSSTGDAGVDYDPVSRLPKSLFRDLGDGARLRLPIDNPAAERPWWPARYDLLLRHPPENLCILKTKEGAYSGRMLPPTEHFRRLMRQFNYTLIKDTTPQPIRMYLINHARRLMIMWGGGGTIHSHLWGGGVSSVPGSNPRFLDVIMLRQSSYNWEHCGFYSCALKKHGVNMKTREKRQRGLQVWIGPPNIHDNVSEAAFSFHYAWTKLVELETLDLMRPEHMVISDEEKKLGQYQPFCRKRELAKEAGGPHRKTRYEFGGGVDERPWGTDPW